MSAGFLLLTMQILKLKLSHLEIDSSIKHKNPLIAALFFGLNLRFRANYDERELQIAARDHPMFKLKWGSSGEKEKLPFLRNRAFFN